MMFVPRKYLTAAHPPAGHLPALHQSRDPPPDRTAKKSRSVRAFGILCDHGFEAARKFMLYDGLAQEHIQRGRKVQAERFKNFRSLFLELFIRLK